MKKLLSLVLVITTLFALTAFSAGAADVDVAGTGGYYVSEKVFEDVADATVIGYLGDLDFDKDITIMDTTKIQRAIAKKTTLSETQTLLADTDRDGVITVMDATDTQRYIAKLSGTSNVAHTLYYIFTNSDKEVYQQIVAFLKKYANYTPSMQRYKYEFYNTDGSGYTMINYFEGDGIMKISNVESFNAGDSEGTMDFTLRSNENYCEFRASLFTGGLADYDTEGVIEYIKEDDEIMLAHGLYYTQTELSQEHADLLIVEQLDMMISSIERFMGSELTGDVYELF